MPGSVFPGSIFGDRPFRDLPFLGVMDRIPKCRLCRARAAAKIIAVMICRNAATRQTDGAAGVEAAMQLLLGQSSVNLDRDQLIAVRDGKGARVTCLAGSLWVTQEDAGEDLVLEAGRSAVIEHPGLTLIMALGPASVRVSDPATRSRFWDRVAGWLRGADLSRPNAIA
jgi:hypothetical protein